MELFTAIIDAIGAMFSLYERWIARKRRRYDARVLATSLEKSKEGLILRHPEPGSDLHLSVCRLVRRGELIRLPMGLGYAVPGQKFNMVWDSELHDAA